MIGGSESGFRSTLLDGRTLGEEIPAPKIPAHWSQTGVVCNYGCDKLDFVTPARWSQTGVVCTNAYRTTGTHSLRDGRKRGWSATSVNFIEVKPNLRIARKRGWSATLD